MEKNMVQLEQAFLAVRSATDRTMEDLARDLMSSAITANLIKGKPNNLLGATCSLIKSNASQTAPSKLGAVILGALVVDFFSPGLSKAKPVEKKVIIHKQLVDRGWSPEASPNALASYRRLTPDAKKFYWVQFGKLAKTVFGL
jgi:hypothetical protein